MGGALEFLEPSHAELEWLGLFDPASTSRSDHLGASATSLSAPAFLATVEPNALEPSPVLEAPEPLDASPPVTSEPVASPSVEPHDVESSVEPEPVDPSYLAPPFLEPTSARPERLEPSDLGSADPQRVTEPELLPAGQFLDPLDPAVPLAAFRSTPAAVHLLESSDFQLIADSAWPDLETDPGGTTLDEWPVSESAEPHPDPVGSLQIPDQQTGRVSLGFRDGTTTSLAADSAQALALEELASLLTRRD